MIKHQETMIRLLDALYPGVKIYLFGSRARGTNQPTSDIDLAIDIGRELTIPELARARDVLDALNMIHMVDVVDLNGVPQKLRETILTEGKVWKN